MVPVTKSEKEKLLKAFPHLNIMRAAKGKSNRHSYMMEENPRAKKYLERIRKENTLSENGVPVSYPAVPEPSSPYYSKYSKDQRDGSKKDYKGSRDKNGEDNRANGQQKREFGKEQNKFGRNYASNNDFKNNGYKSRRPRDSFKPKNGWKTDSSDNYKNYKGSGSRWENKSQYKDKASKKDLWD